MILLLSLCSGSYSQNKVDNDSIKISVNDVKIINQKLVDAKLAEEQLTKARTIINNNREQIEAIVDDEIARILYDKNELISAHIMDENIFNQTKNFTFIQNVLKDGVVIG